MFDDTTYRGNIRSAPTADEFNHRARLDSIYYYDVDGDLKLFQIPKGMHIQAFDVVDSNVGVTRVRHQTRDDVSRAIDLIEGQGKIACIVVLAPDIRPKVINRWHDYKDPLKYMVMPVLEAMKLTKIGETHRNNINRRFKSVAAGKFRNP